MILFNKAEEFVVSFNGESHIVQSGQFDVSNKDVAEHILYTARKWNKDVIVINGETAILSDVVEESPSVETVFAVEEEVVEEVPEEITEAVAEVIAEEPAQEITE